MRPRRILGVPENAGSGTVRLSPHALHPMDSTLELLDWIIVAAYFAAVAAVVALAVRRERARSETQTAEGFFLGGRSVTWGVVGASLFASNIGSEHLVGLAGSGASSGMAPMHFEVLASLILLLLGWVFVPFYLRSGVFTMPEFLERRYGPAARWYLALISIVAYVLTHISVTVYAGATVVTTLTGISFWTAAVAVILATGLYVLVGGLLAVVYADTIQVTVLIAGAIAVTVTGLILAGGFDAVAATSPEGYFDVWKPVDHPSYPWTGIIFGAPLLGIWYWCTEQNIVQRTLAAKSVDHARRGAIFAGFLKLLPAFILVLPGVIAYTLVQQGQLVLPARPMGGGPNYDATLPALVAQLLPIGIRGLVVAGMFAALMGSLAAVFNSCATLVTWDIYRKFRPNASEKRLVWVGRLSTVGLVGLGLAWIPMMGAFQEGQLYTYLQSIQAYISPPIASVFLLGVGWKRANAQGAMAALLSGFVLGLGRVLLELNRDSLAEGGMLQAFATLNFLHFAIALFATCTAILIVVSLLTPAPDEDKIAGLTFATADKRPADQTPADGMPSDAPREVVSDPAWRRTDLRLTAALIACVAVVWLIFS